MDLFGILSLGILLSEDREIPMTPFRKNMNFRREGRVQEKKRVKLLLDEKRVASERNGEGAARCWRFLPVRRE